MKALSMLVLKVGRKDWKLYLPVIILLLITFSFPIILTGIFNGQFETGVNNFIEIVEERYRLYAYYNGDISSSIITPDFKAEIDKILKTNFKSYEGSTISINGHVSLSYESNKYQFFEIVLDDTIKDEFLHIREEYRQNVKSLYSYQINKTFSFVYDEIDNNKQRNPIYSYASSSHNYIPTLKASREVCESIFDLDPGNGNILYLKFKNKVPVKDINKLLSNYYFIVKPTYDNENLNVVVRNYGFSGIGVFLPDIEKNLSVDLLHYTDNGQADSKIKEMIQNRKTSQIISFITVIFTVIVTFAISFMLCEFRKKTVTVVRDLGLRWSIVNLWFSIESLILSLISIILSLPLIICADKIFQKLSVTDPVYLMFTQDGHYVFLPDSNLVLVLIIIVILVPQIAVPFTVKYCKKNEEG